MPNLLDIIADAEDRLDIEMKASGYAEGKKDALDQLELHIHSEHAENKTETDDESGDSADESKEEEEEEEEEEDKTAGIRKLIQQQLKTKHPRRKTRNAAKLSIKGRLCHRMKITSYDD